MPKLDTGNTNQTPDPGLLGSRSQLGADDSTCSQFGWTVLSTMMQKHMGCYESPQEMHLNLPKVGRRNIFREHFLEESKPEITTKSRESCSWEMGQHNQRLSVKKQGILQAVEHAEGGSRGFSRGWAMQSLECQDEYKHHPQVQGMHACVVRTWSPALQADSFPTELQGKPITHSCPTLCDTLAVAHQSSQSVGFSRKECWHGLPCPPPGDLPNPVDRTHVACVSCIAGGFFTC